MGDEALFAELALPVVVSPILEKVSNCGSMNDVRRIVLVMTGKLKDINVVTCS